VRRSKHRADGHKQDHQGSLRSNHSGHRLLSATDSFAARIRDCSVTRCGRLQPHGARPQSLGTIFPLSTRLLAPECLEPCGTQLGVPDRMLNVSVAEPELEGTSIVTLVGQCESTGVSEHMRVNGEG
jgi:hypothetical protein